MRSPLCGCRRKPRQELKELAKLIVQRQMKNGLIVSHAIPELADSIESIVNGRPNQRSGCLTEYTAQMRTPQSGFVLRAEESDPLRKRMRPGYCFSGAGKRLAKGIPRFRCFVAQKYE
jgi:hypothetical protein